MKVNVVNDFSLEEEYNKVREYTEPLNEVSLYRVTKGHDKDGYAMISASRYNPFNDNKQHSDQEIVDENNKRTNKLKADIRSKGYSYVPVFGGYKEEDADRESVEKSFIVFPYDNINRKYTDFNTFEKDLINLSKKYDQDSVLIKRPNDKARYYNNLEDKWDDFAFNSTKLNDIQQTYFTALKGDNKNTRRFTYTESFVMKEPSSIMGRHSRWNDGELV